MRGVLTLLAAVLSLGDALASPLFDSRAKTITFPDPLPIQGPSFFVHDPSLVQRQSDGKYFLFTTYNKGGIITADNLQG
jgi:arabinan endo-1,5-alpha-L-arabinosidase